MPDAFFKIVVRESEGAPKLICFLYPRRKIKKADGKWNHAAYAVTVDLVEALTGIDFLTALPDERESAVESKVTT
ncbi:MAG: DNA/RNA non-specific endonuclease, partial [Alphaproteobacteria bacterium]|nr:DNA/RNA non-specific endonuclease [Alphaproteobacteria bacterium]